MPDQMPVITRIIRVAQETPAVKTIYFDHSFECVPGQFVMVWVPGVDEIPMALSAPDAITVQEVGDATRILGKCNEGDLIGIRGPFGNGFTVHGQVMAVAGGVGAAPLIPLARQHPGVTFLLGARSAADLLYAEELRSCSDLRIATDDGSAGYHGYIAGFLREQELGVYDTICVCGPELMMKSVLDVLVEKKIAGIGQFSLHRYMKCGVGLCGSCCVDPDGLCVCRDGPVFRGDILVNSELGRYHRDASGRKE
jgi:dihydroorotate dehydrogenase electron transfer subunit